MTIGAAQQFFLGASKATGGGAAGYQIERSLRFSSNDSAYCSRVPSVAGNRKTWTWSGWVKRGKLDTGSYYTLFGAPPTGGVTSCINIPDLNTGDGVLEIKQYVSAYDYRLVTTQVFRDPSAWYHIVVAFDTTQSTASNRIKVYVNGTQITTFSTATYPTQNYDGSINNNIAHELGRDNGYGRYWDGYMADIHFIDGQALTPSSFTEVSATTGQLIPKAYTGTYGTNGFHLDFSDNSAATAATLGADSSGNGNNWTPNNLSTGGSLVPISSATGAIPALNTTDIYGRVLGAGVRSDSFAANLELCLPLTVTGGRSLSDDVIPTGRTSAAKTVTLSNLTTSSTNYAFYGSSLRNTSTSSSCIDLPGRIITYGGSFTIECWVYRAPGQSVNLYSDGDKVALLWLSINVNSNGVLDFYSYSGATSNPGSLAVPENTWTHVAFVTNGSTVNYYVNGVKDPTTRSWVSPGGSTGQYQILFQNTNNAYAQDYRIYTGVQKYTSSFTPPKPLLSAADAIGNDSLVDTPTSFGTDTSVGGEVRGNYATLNPLATGTTAALANGNLDFSSASVNAHRPSTVAIQSGKWYCEFLITGGASGGNNVPGIVGTTTPSFPGSNSTSYGYYGATGAVYNNSGVIATYPTFTDGDIISVAFDADSGKIWFAKNGTWQGSGNPGTGANPTATATLGTYFFAAGGSSSGAASCSVNFGQRPFAYTAPSGFKALCDTNLPAPVVAKPNEVFQAKTYQGTGSTQSVTGLLFSPDLVWIKDRTSANYHTLQDIVRGATKDLYSNTTDAEGTYVNSLNAFNSDGFTIGNSGWVNTNNNSYIAWAWDAGSSTVSNTQGSITSSVRANASAGFSIVSYTGTGSTNTVGHGLNVTPSLIICKTRAAAVQWVVYHASLGKDAFLGLNTTDASITSASYWGSGVTSTVFGLQNLAGGNNNGSMIAYCFAPVAGYSSSFSYTGNGSTDGVFVYLGFRAKLLLIKRTDTTGNWYLWDTVRNTYNVVGEELYPNLSNAAATATDLDILSNGFKMRSTAADFNASGGTYVGFAISETAFQYSRAR